MGSDPKMSAVLLRYRLECLMKRKKLSAEKLGKLTGIKKGYIYRYLNGTCRPGEQNIKKLAAALEVSEDYLKGKVSGKQETVPYEPDKSQCRSCRYYIRSSGRVGSESMCGYMLETGEKRPCKPGRCKESGVWESKNRKKEN